MICNKCKEDKLREFSHVTKDGRNSRRYRGLNGGLWNGHTCPQCYKIVLKNRAKRKTPNKEAMERYIETGER